MRAFVAPGARQEIGDQDRDHEPGEYRDFERARHARAREIDRKRRERDQRAEQPRRDEGAMPRRGQRILLHGRMDKAVDIVAKRPDEAQGNHAPAYRPTHSPFTADRVGRRLSER